MAQPPHSTTTTIIEDCLVAPSLNNTTSPEQELPLLRFDIEFLFAQRQIILFYELVPCSRSHFLSAVVPRLRNSLALSLTHFLPLAGNIVLPAATSSTTPFIRYAAGDAVLLTIAESSADYNHFSDDEINALVPPLPRPTISSDSSTLLPIAAVQITLFPNKFFCIGFAFQHAACDGASIVRFLHAWASVSKSDDGETHMLMQKWMPFYDRSTVLEAPYELDLISAFWSQVKSLMMKPISMQDEKTHYSKNIAAPSENSSITCETCNAKFVLTDADIQKLKNFVRHRRPGIAHLTSFSVVSSHLWVCLVKLAAVAEDQVTDEETEYFTCTADCRNLLKPNLPDSYFGNCLALVKAEADHATLNGDEGFLAAAEIIGESIRKAKEQVHIRDEIKIDAVKNQIAEVQKLMRKRALRISWSPKFDFYSADFGWGRVTKFDDPSKCQHGSASLWKSKEKIHGGIEISMAISKMQLECFSSIYHDVLNSYYVD